MNGHGNLFDYLHKPPVNRLTYWQVVQIAAGISGVCVFVCVCVWQVVQIAASISAVYVCMNAARHFRDVCVEAARRQTSLALRRRHRRRRRRRR